MPIIGIVGGLGPESTIDYYHRILQEWKRDSPSSSPSMIIDSLDVDLGLRLVAHDRPALIEYLSASLSRLAAAGTEGVPGGVATLLHELVAEVPRVPLPEAASRAEIMTALEASVVTVTNALGTWGDEDLHAEWRMTLNGETLLAMPRIEMVRSIMLNHWYHHRGEMIVYLRLLDVPIPAIYGPTADENPFAGSTAGS